MKTIRNSVFETNSSSTHSLTIYGNDKKHEMNMSEFITRFLDVNKFREYAVKHGRDNKFDDAEGWVQLYLNSINCDISVEYDG